MLPEMMQPDAHHDVPLTRRLLLAHNDGLVLPHWLEQLAPYDAIDGAVSGGDGDGDGGGGGGGGEASRKKGRKSRRKAGREKGSRGAEGDK
jgi:hypothetical protein